MRYVNYKEMEDLKKDWLKIWNYAGYEQEAQEQRRQTERDTKGQRR